MKLRFHLTTLMGAVLFVTLGLAAFRSLSNLCVSATFTATVLILSAAAVGAIAAPGPLRAPWAGTALFGWIYLGLVFGPWPHNAEDPPPLLTVPLLEAAQDYLVSDGKTPYYMIIHKSPQNECILISSWAHMSSGSVPPGGYKTISLPAYRQVGHSLGALLFGLLGAVVGRFFASRYRVP